MMTEGTGRRSRGSDPQGPAVATLIAVVGTGVDIDVALNAGDAQLFEQGSRSAATGSGRRRMIQMSPLMVVPVFGAGLGLDVGGKRVGTEFEAGGERSATPSWWRRGLSCHPA